MAPCFKISAIRARGRPEGAGELINLIILLLFYCGLSARPNETAIKCANKVRVPIVVRFECLYFERFRIYCFGFGRRMINQILLFVSQSNPYALKDSGGAGDMTAWTSAGLQPTTGYYPYDPTLAAYG